MSVRQDVTVRDSKGKRHTVMAYVMTDLFREAALPSPFYFNGIREGYRQNGMDETPLADALTQCRREVSKQMADRQLKMFAANDKSNHQKKEKKHRER